MVTEIYKDIKGYEGIYQVSNLGNVRSLYRTYINSRGAHMDVKGTILKPNKKRTGYLEVSLCLQGKIRSFLIHRLVANNFIPKLDIDKTDVNHIDGDKTNNVVSNLEWCTKSLNSLHAVEHNLSEFRDSIFNNLKIINDTASYKKIIFIRNSDILEFGSISLASRSLNLKRDNITSAIRRHQRVGGWQVFGYKIANEEDPSNDLEVNLVGK